MNTKNISDRHIWHTNIMDTNIMVDLFICQACFKAGAFALGYTDITIVGIYSQSSHLFDMGQINN